MSSGLTEPPSDPFLLYSCWVAEAEAAELNDPNAAALATAGADGAPSVRMVLIKHAGADGFWFFTNAQSRKGGELAANPRAALCFHWKSLRRQVRVAGPVSALSAQQSDEYFHSRSRRSQVGAAVSRQSRPLASRDVMEEAVQRFADQYPEQVPRPAWWHGFSVRAEQVEFWADGPDRLHDRILYTLEDQRWTCQRLWP